DPGRTAGVPDSPGQAHPARKRRRAAAVDERGDLQRRVVPGASATQRLAPSIHLPESAVVPAQRFADRGQHPRRGLGQRGRFAEGPRDVTYDGWFGHFAQTELRHYTTAIHSVPSGLSESLEEAPA